MEKFEKFCLTSIAVVIAEIACVLSTMLIWNMLVPPVFHGPRISFFQAFVGTFLYGVLIARSKRFSDNVDMLKLALTSTVTSVVFLVFAWIITLFI